MASMYSVVDTYSPTYLCADPQGADVISVPVVTGSGTIARGTVLYRNSNGKYAAADTTDCVDTNQLVVLNEDVTLNATVSEVASVYRAGRLIAGKVKTLSGTTYTPVTEAIKVVLRMQGIVFEPAIV